MTPTLRELLTDLKAAVLIGHPEAIDSALDGVRALDDDDLPESAILSLGRTLTPLPANILKPVFVDDDPAIRSLVAVALGERYMQGKDVPAGDLDIPAEDPVPEVRLALARALTEFKPPRPDWLAPLAEGWLQPPDGHGKVQPTTLPALLLLPHLSSAPIHLLSALDTAEDHDFRIALVNCLGALAENGQADSVYELLSTWASRPKPNVWVITRALSSAWALAQPQTSTRILNELAAQTGMIRPVARALERLQ